MRPGARRPNRTVGTRRRRAVAALIAALLAGCAARHQGDGARLVLRFDSPTAGVSIAKPAGWYVTSQRQAQEAVDHYRLPDERLKAAVRESAHPLFHFSKYPMSDPRVNPSIGVSVSRITPGALADRSPAALLELLVASRRVISPDLTLVGAVDTAVVSGLPAAHSDMTHTLVTVEGSVEAFRLQTWLVRRGDDVIKIEMSGAQYGPDTADDEFRLALASIEIRPAPEPSGASR